MLFYTLAHTNNPTKLPHQHNPCTPPPSLTQFPPCHTLRLDPSLVTRAATLLQSGCILGRVWQSYESHVPYLLQFKIDLNLAGMAWMTLDHCRFRTPLPDMLGDKGNTGDTEGNTGDTGGNTWDRGQHRGEKTPPGGARGACSRRALQLEYEAEGTEGTEGTQCTWGALDTRRWDLTSVPKECLWGNHDDGCRCVSCVWGGEGGGLILFTHNWVDSHNWLCIVTQRHMHIYNYTIYTSHIQGTCLCTQGTSQTEYM